MTGFCSDCGNTACICPVPSAATGGLDPWVYGDPMTPSRLDRIRLAADGPGVTDEQVDDLLAEVDRLRSELHDANVAAVGAAMLHQDTLKERDALRAAMERITYGPCEPGCDSESGAPCICWLDVARRALAGRADGGEMSGQRFTADFKQLLRTTVITGIDQIVCGDPGCMGPLFSIVVEDGNGHLRCNDCGRDTVEFVLPVQDSARN